jgi:hypothetical protein
MKTFGIDLTRLPSSGHGTARIPTDGVRVGDTIGVYDVETAVFAAEVLAVLFEGQVEIRVHWDRELQLS